MKKFYLCLEKMIFMRLTISSRKNTFLYKCIAITALFLVLNTDKIAAQKESIYLNLDDVIVLAQERSPDAMINVHRFRRSYWEFRSFKAGYLPNVTLDATLPNFARTIEAIVQEDGSEKYRERNLSRYNAGLSINQKVGWTGGSVFLRTGLQRSDNLTSGSHSTQYLSTPVSIGFTQPIFGYNAYKWDKKTEPMVYEEAERSFLESTEQVAITAINYFFNLLIAQVEREIALKNQSNYDTLFNIAKGRYMLGKIAENELLQLELNLLQATSTVETADLNYQNNLFTFKSYIRLVTNSDIVLIPPTEISYFQIDVSEAVSEALSNSSSILSYERQLIEAQSQISRAKLNGRFDATLNASFGLTQTASELSDVYKKPLDEEVVSLGISVPLLDWGQARGQIRMAESNFDLVLATIEQNRIDFEQNIFLKVMQFNMQKNQLMIAAKADTVAQKRFDVTQKRYMIGKVNDVLELNNAQIDNDNAKIRYFTALKTYWTNYYEVRKLTLFDFRTNQKLKFIPEDKIVR